jgi:uroporphyrinogen III methyltransferase/synthase
VTQSSGKVYLVGAGPGDPGLLTLRGAECIREADVILFDYLASPQLLVDARADAERICLGRHGRGRLMSQSEINAAMIRHAQSGRSVVRLKGGDPTIFARLAEELAALESAGVPYEIVPGVTAAQAASSYAGIPLTQRDDASCVAFVTGQESADKSPRLDYAALADFPGTLVFYMGVTTAPAWSRLLLDHGKQPETPVAIVRRCSLSEQETLFTSLGEVGDIVRRRKLRPPAVIIVGEVARARDTANWFTTRPLFGRTVLVTRPEHQSHDLSHRLRGLGANVLYQPAIEIGPPRDWSIVDGVVERLAEFDWLVFSSANGVKYFFDRLTELGHDARRLGQAKLAAIGPATVAALAERNLRADVRPETYRAEALAAALASQVRGKRIFLARASRGREELAESLINAGAHVEQAVVYESRDVAAPCDAVIEALAAGQIDWITVTSSAIARSVVRLFGEHLSRTRLTAISPLTADTLGQLGHPAAAVAEVYTADGVANAIVLAESRKA